MSSIRTLGYCNVDASEKLASWMSDPKTLLIDIRYSPSSYLRGWGGEVLQQQYGQRYRWAGNYLGNVNHKYVSSPIKLASEQVGIQGLRRYLDKGFSLVLLCGCRRYASCHRKTVVELLPQAMPEVVVEAEGPPVETIKCLSVRQPYAHWILHPEMFLAAGLEPKEVENRTWKVSHRRRMAIHAGGTFEEGAIEYWTARVPQLASVVPQRREAYRLGAILGTVDLVDIVQESSSMWYMPGQYGWVLANAQAIEPIVYKGRQGLFEVAASLVEQCEGVGV